MAIKDTIDKYFQYVNDGKFDQLFDLFCEDADLSCPVDFKAKGIENIKTFHLKVPENYPEHIDTPIDILVQENRAAVLIQFQGKNASGTPASFVAADWFTFKDDKIQTLQIFYDSLGLSRRLKN